MKLPLTNEISPRVLWLDSAESTNSELKALVAAGAAAGAAQLPHGTLVVTANQTAGRGRQGRGWETPPNTALATSLLLRIDGSRDPAALGMSWLPLLAGSAVARALQPLFTAEDRDAP